MSPVEMNGIGTGRNGTGPEKYITEMPQTVPVFYRYFSPGANGKIYRFFTVLHHRFSNRFGTFWASQLIKLIKLQIVNEVN